MSEASAPRTHPFGVVVARASMLVARAFVILVLAAGSARADGILEPVEDAVSPVAGATASADAASGAVEDVSSSAAASIEQTVEQTVDTVTGTVGGTTQVAGSTVGALTSTVGETVDATTQIVGGAVDATTQTAGDAAGSIAAVVPASSNPASPSREPGPTVAPSGHTEGPAPAQPSPPTPGAPQPWTPHPGAYASTAGHVASTLTGAEGYSPGTSANVNRPGDHRLPTVPIGAAGSATPARDGPRDAGSRGLQLAAILVAALLLARDASRWLRLEDRARAPTPFIPIFGRPG